MLQCSTEHPCLYFSASPAFLMEVLNSIPQYCYTNIGIATTFPHICFPVHHSCLSCCFSFFAAVDEPLSNKKPEYMYIGTLEGLNLK